MNAATTARATNQSAAITLLAAASAKPAAQSPRDDSFAQALSQANDPKAGGLFAKPGAAEPRARAAAPTKNKPAPSESPATQETAAASKPRESADDATAAPARAPQKAATPEPDADKATPIVAESTQLTSQPTTQPAAKPIPIATTPHERAEPATTQTAPLDATTSLTAPTTARTSARSLDPAAKSAEIQQPAASETALQPVAAEAAEQSVASEPTPAKRGPSDPLRLIQTAETKPIAAETAIEAKPNTATSGVAPSDDTSPVVTSSSPKNAADSKPASTNQPLGFGFTQPGKTVPQNTPGAAPSTAGQISSTSNSNTATTTIGSPRLDPSVQPPRLPGGRTPEVPINLKFTARPTNQSSGLSQSEADTAATQISRGLTTALRNKSGQLTLWMNPEALGKLRVQLSVDGANISARFEATSEATKQLLSQNVDALRGALEARGLKVTSLEVVAIPDWSVKANSDQQLPPGSKTEDNPGSFQQHTNQNFSQSGNQSGDPHGRNHPELSSAKFDWLREPDPAPAATPRADANLRTDSRLIGLNARLELDAVA